MESQHKVKADEWVAEENGLKEDKFKLQEQLSDLSKELEGTRDKQTQLQKLIDDSNKEIEHWQMKFHQLESKISEMEERNLHQVSTCCY